MQNDVVNTDTNKGKEIPMPKECVDNMISKFQSAGPGRIITLDEVKALREKKKARQNASK